MAIWRMSFHVGQDGDDMFPECLRLGIAAMTYLPLANTDLTPFDDKNKPTRWNELSPGQKSSLSQLAFHMQDGDIIYVKDHQQIINRGRVIGVPGQRAYQFDSKFRLIDPKGTPWSHQVRVDWLSDFTPKRLLLNAEMTTVLALNKERIALLESAFASDLSKTTKNLLPEDGYYRETQQSRKFIARLHNNLSNGLRNWLRKTFAINAMQEVQGKDIEFKFHGKSVLAELKTCFGIKPRHAVREALGQLLEYSYYPGRYPLDEFLVVLDTEPSEEDKKYIERLREVWSLPLHLGWPSKLRGFEFSPPWPK